MYHKTYQMSEINGVSVKIRLIETREPLKKNKFNKKKKQKISSLS